MNHFGRFTAICCLSVATLGLTRAQSRDAIAGIDHIPLAVRDLEAASQTFSQLGFSIKPGRAHAAGLQNRHIKFPDGSGVELITVGSASDELSASYLKHLRAGDGPAYVAFHVRDAAKLASALAGANIDFRQTAGMTTFNDPRLGFVFITPDNRSPTDRPEHFAHANGAVAMSEVWIACEEPAALKALLLALGARSKVGTVRVPDTTQGEVFELQNGRVVVVPGRHQLREGRPVIGVVMSTMRAPSESPPQERAQVSTSRSSGLIQPNLAHGFWMEFRAER